MPRYYAYQRGWSSGPKAPRFERQSRGRLAGWGLIVALVISAACTSSQAPAAQMPSPEVQDLNKQAEAAERRREHHVARDLLQRAIKTASDPVSGAYANRKMAAMLLFWHEEVEALLYLQASLEHDPNQVPVWNDLGVVQSRLGHPQKARAALERAVELDPKQPISRLTLAAELVRQSEFRSALSHYKILLTLDIPPKIENATHRAISLLNREMGRQD
jgi:tetratricopeptide (TPR) repeat protein